MASLFKHIEGEKKEWFMKVKCYILVVLWMPLISNFDDKRSKKEEQKNKNVAYVNKCVHIFSAFSEKSSSKSF